MTATGTILGWLDGHADLVTALATVMLVSITAVYVRATFQLVSAQRLQAQKPDVVGSFAGTDGAGIKAQNIGNGTASQLALLRGPGEGVGARIEMLGVRRSLLPGDELTWDIQPPTPAGYELGELPLTIIYFDNDLATLYFKVMLLRFEGEAPTLRVRNLGFVPGYCSAGDLRQQARGQMANRLRRVSYHWRNRKKGPTQLILEEETRAPLRAFLGKQVELLREADPKLARTRTTL
jgi:hypothetical protein